MDDAQTAFKVLLGLPDPAIWIKKEVMMTCLRMRDESLSFDRKINTGNVKIDQLTKKEIPFFTYKVIEAKNT